MKINYFVLNLIMVLIIQQPLGACCQGCQTSDCPLTCGESPFECKDRSDICESMKDHCENFFLRRCLRCACPKTCGVCGNHSSSSSSEEETTTTEQTSTTEEATTTTSTSTSSTTTTTTPEPTTTTELSIDENRVSCVPCETRRKYLNDMYLKYYPGAGGNLADSALGGTTSDLSVLDGVTVPNSLESKASTDTTPVVVASE